MLEGNIEIQAYTPFVGRLRFAVGDEFMIADASVAPFFARMEVALKNDYGAYTQGEGTKSYQLFQSDPKYTRFGKYFSDLNARDSFKSTFDEVRWDEIPISKSTHSSGKMQQIIKDQYSRRFPALCAQKQNA